MRFQSNSGPDAQRSVVRISIADMMALHIRAKKSENRLPNFLYQRFPESAMSLFASIPRGTPAVSIPQQNGRYPILPASSAAPDEFVIVYTLKPNGRYEALEVLSHGQAFGIVQFSEIASRWVEDQMGGIRILSGRHAYFAPTRKEWGVILRDGGFTIVDPSTMVFELELLRKRADQSSSGIIARIPLYAGNRSHTAAPIPLFERVELTFDPDPGPESRWIDFVECQRVRAMRSRPPGIIVPQFREWLKRLTQESGFQSWAFRRGMFFGDRIEWWQDKNRRRTLHEGIDFAEGLLPDGTVQLIPEGTPVRALADGEITCLLDDFLNKTVVVRHSAIRTEEGDVFCTFYSHIRPEPGTAGAVRKGQSLGIVAKSKNVPAPAHLHLTGAWAPDSIQLHDITIDQISAAFMPIVLINFNSLISSGQ